MIVADTSVWVEALRVPEGQAATTLQALIDADEVALPLPVRIELIAGVSGKDRSRLRRGLSALSLVFPDEDTWRTVETWVPAAADVGYTFGVSDLLVAALARDIDALIWAFDQDFADMEQLKMVRLYADLPPRRRRVRR